MKVDVGGINTLKKLGFSEYEARVIYALLRLREADVKLISKHSGVPRTKAYEVLRRLVEKGLVAEIQTKPLRYSIIDPEGFIDKLYKEKERELERLKRELELLKNILPVLSSERREAENYIIKVSSPEDFLKLVKDRITSPTIVGYTRESAKYLKGIGDEEYRSPVDFILTPSELFIPLNPLGTPQREYIIVVFTNPYVMEMVRLWAEEVLSIKG